jgi:hypothetical protein
MRMILTVLGTIPEPGRLALLGIVLILGVVGLRKLINPKRPPHSS